MPAAQGSGRARRARPRSGAGVRSRGLFALGRGPRWGGGRQAALLLRAAPSAGPLRGRAPACSCRLRAPPLPHGLRPRARGGRGFRSSHPPKASARGGTRHAHLAAPEPDTCGMLPKASTCGSGPRQTPGPGDLWKSSAGLWTLRGPIFPGGGRLGQRMGEDLYIFPKEAKDPSIASPNLSLQNGVANSSSKGPLILACVEKVYGRTM